ncbi:hypothetical protein [Dietzia sp.]|uniref:hypothetical protein n=1 Tax=Dietzia sp. TaxID=1871616 RepID=UPI002FDA8C5B
MSSTVFHATLARRAPSAAADNAPDRRDPARRNPAHARHAAAARALALYSAAALVAGTLLCILATPLVGEMYARLLAGGIIAFAVAVVAYCDETVRRVFHSTW